MKKWLNKMLCLSLSAAITLSLLTPAAVAASSSAATGAKAPVVQTTLPSQDWQARVSFPDWAGYVDDTLAMNSLYSFTCFQDQGKLYVTPDKDVTGFRLFVNNAEVDTSAMKGGSTWQVDISSLTVDGANTVQVSLVRPYDAHVQVDIPYPSVISGDPKEVGMDDSTLELIGDFVEAEVKYGFSGAQLAVIKDGKLVVSEAWGAASGYRSDLSRIEPDDDDYVPVTTGTLYDLASNTKMYSVNYALQYMLSHEGYDIALDDLIVKFFPQFDDEGRTIFKEGTTNEQKADIYRWKGQLTVRDILMHQAGFDPDPQYYNNNFDQATQTHTEGAVNALYSQNRETTLDMVLASPLTYEPGTKTVYSDVDYMLLCFVIEKVTGQGLDQFLKEKFWEPMGLTHITYKPLDNGFTKEQCAATEPSGNHWTDLAGNGWAVDFDNCREGLIQGTVHDAKAYYSMDGVSGHAGLFANAEDLARLCSLMLTGGYEGVKYFDNNVIDEFTKPKSTDYPTWGLGWWRQGAVGRRNYFSTHASSGTVGHQGWTGTLTVIDPEQDLVVVLLTNKKNSPVLDNTESMTDYFGDNMALGSLGAVVGYVYDSFTSSPDAMDDSVRQYAYDRICLSATHHDAYDEAPHMNDAFAMLEWAVVRAEKRPCAETKANAEFLYGLLSGYVSGKDGEVFAKPEDKANAAKWLAELKTRVDALDASKPIHAAPKAAAVKVSSAPGIDSKTGAFTGGGQNAVYFPRAYGVGTAACYDNAVTWFEGYEGQGKLYFSRIGGGDRDVSDLAIYVNGVAVDVSAMIEDSRQGSIFEIDVSGCAVNGRNTVQVGGIKDVSRGTDGVFLMVAPDPEIIDGSGQGGVDPKVLAMIGDIVAADVEYGFPSAQLAIVKDGRMVYSNAWGAVNSYRSDLSPILEGSPDYKEATTGTLYDLASNTKMYAVNYALQYMLAHSGDYDDISLSDPITKFFPQFDDEGKTVFKTGTTDAQKTEIYRWKSQLTIQDILMHQAGFDPDPQYYNDNFDQDTQQHTVGAKNTLFSQDKETTLNNVLASPLNYQPGAKTVYSDVDYMLLGFIIEQVSAQDLDSFLKEHIYQPLGLEHITYTPLEKGFQADDCAATEPSGNHWTDLAGHGWAVDFTNCREEVLQGTVHDAKAYYSMEGVSGHAGLYSNAEDLAKLAQVMLNPTGYGATQLFAPNVNGYFAARKDTLANWGQGWWRQGDCQRPWYFGVQADRDTIGHQGWTGTLTMIDPSSELVMAYLTNKINSPIYDSTTALTGYCGNWYTSATLGFVANLLYLGLEDHNAASDIQPALDALLADMALDKLRLVEEEGPVAVDHPVILAAQAVVQQVKDMAAARPTAQNKAALDLVMSVVRARVPAVETLAVSLDASVSGGEASLSLTAAQSAELVERAVAQGCRNVTIQAKAEGSATKAVVSIPAGALAELASKTGASLTVATPVAEVAIPNSGLSGLTGDSKTIEVSAQRKGQTVTVSVAVDGETVDQVAGGMTVLIVCDDCTPGMAAALVGKDGRRQTIRKSVVSESGIKAPVDGSVQLEIVDEGKSFSDVSAGWAAEAAAYVSGRGLFQTSGADEFDGGAPMSRGALAQVLYELEGCPAPGAPAGFSDVKDSEYADAVAWASEAGLMSGYGDGRFGVEDTLTREQAAVIFWRYADSPAPIRGVLDFTDAGRISGYAGQAMRWAVENGVLSGRGGGVLDPGGKITRLEAAKLLLNFMSM